MVEQRNLAMLDWIRQVITKIKLELVYRKKIKELKKKDPFIY